MYYPAVLGWEFLAAHLPLEFELLRQGKEGLFLAQAVTMSHNAPRKLPQSCDKCNANDQQAVSGIRRLAIGIGYAIGTVTQYVMANRQKQCCHVFIRNRI